MRRRLPANFAAVAINGLFFPTAGRILGAGLLLTWFVSDLTPSATLVATIIPIQDGLALIAQRTAPLRRMAFRQTAARLVLHGAIAIARRPLVCVGHNLVHH